MCVVCELRNKELGFATALHSVLAAEATWVRVLGKIVNTHCILCRKKLDLTMCYCQLGVFVDCWQKFLV